MKKPVALTKEEGELLLATQKETGAKAQVGQVVRICDEYVWLKEAADKKEYGEIRTAVFRRLSAPATWAWEGWLDDAARSGSMALDLHVHDVDFMRYLMGEPENFNPTEYFKRVINNAEQYEEEFLPPVWKNMTKEAT